jgi:aryl-alcohol dehydrogenase-like predicted oxidoreductase
VTLQVQKLGGAGPAVSALGLGTMTFGVETAEADAHAQLDLFAELGGTLIDTADVYGDGESERIIGRWLKSRRPTSVVLATKGRFGSAPDVLGASPRALANAVEASMGRLGVDHIDLYYVHGWDQATPVEESLEALSAMVHDGKIGAIGWSNTTGWQLQRILTTARLAGHVVPTAIQPQYNLLDRGIEWELLPCCLEEGIGVVPWSPLGGGWLTGKYDRTARPTGPTRLGDDPDRGVEAYDIRNTDRVWYILDAVAAIAERLGRPMAHVALAWLAARPGVSSVLLGARTLDQLRSNLDAADLALDEQDQNALTVASAPGLPPYPYGMVEQFCEVPYWQELGTAQQNAQRS